MPLLAGSDALVLILLMFLSASLDRFNILGLRDRKLTLKRKLNLQNLAIFMAKCGKFDNFVWQNLAKFRISKGNFLRCQVNIRNPHACGITYKS